MPPATSQANRHSFASVGPPQPGAARPQGPAQRLTSRSRNDAVLLAGRPPLVRPRTAPGPTLLVFLTDSGLTMALAYVQFSQGVMDGLGDSLKGTWSLLSHDMWQLATYREMGTTLTALSLLDPFDVRRSLVAAQAFDARWGTHVAQRMAEIIGAVKKLLRDAPHWSPRQWGRAVGRVLGDLVLAKGTGAAGKLAMGGATTLNRVAATRYLARTPQLAEAFGEVESFNIGMGQRSLKVQEALQGPKKAAGCPTKSWLPAPKPFSRWRSTTPARATWPGCDGRPGGLVFMSKAPWCRSQPAGRWRPPALPRGR